jgi:shikimate dehydrogenase
MLHAANTLVRIDGGWRAENTDVVGIGMALQVAEVETVPRAAILGAGGTAAAAAVALASLGAEHIEIVVREPARAADLVGLLEALGVATTVSGFGTSAVDAPLVVSTVPAAGQPAAAELPWRGDHTVLDVLYDPWPTPLAGRVRAAGGTVLAGSEVLFWQATVQVELMTGHAAPLDAMRRALVAALNPV